MSKLKVFSVFVIASILLLSLSSSLASGPVYDDLPDLEGQEIIIAVENFYTPYQFIDPRADAPIGFEYDVVAEICNRVNCTPVYENTTFDVQLAGVRAGDYDMAMNGLFITEERQEIYDFSIPYTQAEAFLLVRADEDRFDSVEEFVEKAESEDLIWGIQTNSFGEVLAGDIYSVPDDQTVTFDEFGALLVALQNGDIDTMYVDAFGGKFVSVGSEHFKLIGFPLVDPVPMGLLFQKGSSFVEPFNAAIESMKADGYIDFLHYKWSTDFSPLGE